MLAGIAKEYLGITTPTRHEIQVNVLGINHFTWVDQASCQGEDLLACLTRHISKPDVLRRYTQTEVEGWNDWFHSTDLVKFTLFLRFGILAAAGDRHLVEFMPGFISSPELLFKWGIIRTPVSYRISRWQSAPQKTRDLMTGATPFSPVSSGEEGVGMIKALLGLGDLVTNVNLENSGQIYNLPCQAVVETNALFSHDSVKPIVAGNLPPSIAALTNQHVTNQELVIDAVLGKDYDLAFQALFNDPTNSLSLDASRELFNSILELNQEFLTVPTGAKDRA